MYTFAVHVRRGDISLCEGDFHNRYLPNLYYLLAIQQALRLLGHPKNYKVTVYSQSDHDDYQDDDELFNYERVEDFEDFTKRGYTLNLDGSVEEAWQAMIEADVTISSVSSFSSLPSFLKFHHGLSIHPPGEFMLVNPTTFPNWVPIDNVYEQDTLAELKRLRALHCPDVNTTMIHLGLRPKTWMVEDQN